MNPGGNYEDPDHSRFAMQAGSAYEIESWAGYPKGQSPLQKQIVSLFRRLEVDPAQVLAGNLVPFRSPSWGSLSEREAALKLGFNLWQEVLRRVRPSTVVSMGRETNILVRRLLEVRDLEFYPVAWGKQVAWVGSHSYGGWIGLPHLSRYKVMDRPQSRAALDKAFASLAARDFASSGA